MRLLYFSSRECWPTNTGARLRDYHLASQLATRAQVSYVGLRSSPQPPPPPPPDLPDMTILPRGTSFSKLNLLKGLLGPTAVTLHNTTSPELIESIRRIVQEGRYDTVQLEGVHLLHYLPALRAAPSRPPIVCDWHNIESELMERYAGHIASLPRRLYARRTTTLIRNAERQLLERCEFHTVCSEREKQVLLQVQPNARIAVIGNGVDVAFFAEPGPAGPRRRLSFVGSMDYHANIDAVLRFVRETWPSLRQRWPDLIFTVVGKDPSPAIRNLAAEPRIEVTGTVDDLRPYYRESIAVAVPLWVGGGTRLKILEAMAAGVPVISTTLGAEGLAAEPGRHYLLADTAAEFQNALELLMPEAEQWHMLKQAGRDLVTRHYDWTALGRQLWDVHCQALAMRNSTP